MATRLLAHTKKLIKPRFPAFDILIYTKVVPLHALGAITLHSGIKNIKIISITKRKAGEGNTGQEFAYL